MNASAVPAAVALSVVIPVYNEEANLPVLFARLYPVLDGLGRPYEVIFTNDGSADRSFTLLQAQHAARPDVTRVIDFNANYGQHMAIMAALSVQWCRGGRKAWSPQLETACRSPALAATPPPMLRRSTPVLCAAR